MTLFILRARFKPLQYQHSSGDAHSDKLKVGRKASYSVIFLINFIKFLNNEGAFKKRGPLYGRVFFLFSLEYKILSLIFL